MSSMMWAGGNPRTTKILVVLGQFDQHTNIVHCTAVSSDILGSSQKFEKSHTFF